MKHDQDNVITWAQFNNVVPIIFTLISVTLSVALFWYQIKLEITEIKGEQKLTNQKLDALTSTITTKFVEVDTHSKEIGSLTLKVTTLETIEKQLHNRN